MSDLPLARKYRPQTFADLIGQPHVTATLTRAIEQRRVGQAYLFAGQRGVGKTSAARVLAKGLNCASGPTAKPCGTCASCVQITQGTSLDVVEIDGASNRGIDEIRGLRETVAFAPTSGTYRIYIIDEVHMLTAEAFNALLKTLEEPPAHVKFIFATTAAQKVPATVLSRCQRFDFRRLEPGVVVEALGRIAEAERLMIDGPALYAITRACEGSLRDAEIILEQLASFTGGPITERDVTGLLGSVESQALFAWVQAMLERDVARALVVMAAQADQGREPPQLLAGLLRHVRNLLIVRSVGQAASTEDVCARLVDEPPDRLRDLKQQAGQASSEEWLCILQVLTGAYDLVRRSPVAQTVLELIVIKLASRERWESLDAISRRIEALGRLDRPRGEPDSGEPDQVRGALTGMPRAHGMSPAAAEHGGAPSPASGSAQAPAAAHADSPERAAMLAELWPVFLERLGARKMSLAAYLGNARPLGQEGCTLIVGLPGFALHQEVLNSLENRKLIERLLSELGRAPVTVRYATLPDEPPASPSTRDAPSGGGATPPLVQEVVNLFNATILDQPRPI